MLSFIHQNRDFTWRGGGGGGGGGEARRGDGGARAGGRAAAPRRPRAAGINDAFPRPHANFQFFCNKSSFWMFNWWFQKLGVSEPTPDGLALTFEFVRSKKGWFCDENVTLSPKVAIFHWFLKVFRKQCCCGCSGVGRATTALQPQHHFFRKCCKTNGFSKQEMYCFL